MTNRYWYDPDKPDRLADIAARDAQIDENEVAFRTDDIGGGGGGSGLSVIGPYTVNFNDDGVLDATFKICDLAAGTIVVKTWAFMTTPWTTDPADGSIIFTIGLGGSDWASGDWWDVFRYDATWFLQNEFSAVETRLFDGGNANDARQVAGIVHDAGALNAYIQPSGGVLASGSAEVYALILAP